MDSRAPLIFLEHSSILFHECGIKDIECIKELSQCAQTFNGSVYLSGRSLCE